MDTATYGRLIRPGTLSGGWSTRDISGLNVALPGKNELNVQFYIVSGLCEH